MHLQGGNSPTLTLPSRKTAFTKKVSSIQEIIGGWIRRKASVLAALLFSCANYFYKKAKQYFSPCPKLPRLETLWENLETRWIRNTAYLFCKSCFARRESKGGGVSPLLSALLIYPLSISWFFCYCRGDSRLCKYIVFFVWKICLASLWYGRKLSNIDRQTFFV